MSTTTTIAGHGPRFSPLDRITPPGRTQLVDRRAPERTPRGNLLDRVGGPAAVEAAVQVFYGRVLLDPLLAPYFDGLDLAAQRTHLRAFLVHALGGRAEYRGRDLAVAHAHLALTHAHVDAVAGHLVGTLDALGVAPDVIDEVAATIAPLRDVLVTSD